MRICSLHFISDQKTIFLQVSLSMLKYYAIKHNCFIEAGQKKTLFKKKRRSFVQFTSIRHLFANKVRII